MEGLARVSVAVPPCAVGAPARNADNTLVLWRQAHDVGSALVVFPELGLTGYTARDMLLDTTLLDGARAALADLVKHSATLTPMAIVGMPLALPWHGGVYNVAVALQGGKILGVVPKSFLPTYREFEERRWFRPGTEVPAGSVVDLCGQEVPFGTDVLFCAQPLAGLVVGVELCEDLWVPIPPSSRQVGAGATVCCNLSASNFVIGKAEVRRMLCTSASLRGICAYVYAGAGPGESSTDLAFDADAFVCENGHVLAESKRFSRTRQLVTVDVDVAQLLHDRRTTGTFGDCAHAIAFTPRRVSFRAHAASGLMREVTPHPFLPSDDKARATRLWETFEIQSHALATRMASMTTASFSPKLVLGVSGGLDSTHAALVCAQALDLLGRPRNDLVCVTMPGFGTSGATRANAEKLATQLGSTLRVMDIAEVSRLVLAATSHPATVGVTTTDELIARVRADRHLGDATFENVQARVRTLLLMTLANQLGGLVVGTGDLSEKALGWSTYAGDHISMYDVNAGVPKTLMQHIIRWVAHERVETWVRASQRDDAAQVRDTRKDTPEDTLKDTLLAIVDTPISPELLPTAADGAITHLTESSVGPYELHDFYLFHFIRHGASPAQILDLARAAFGGRYALEEHKRWLRVFVQRFFAHQFKRSCTADAPKVGPVALSPRGDWRMPSDMSPEEWLKAIDAYEADRPGER